MATQLLGVITFYTTVDSSSLSSAPVVVIVDAYCVPATKGVPVVAHVFDGGVTAPEGDVLECIPR